LNQILKCAPSLSALRGDLFVAEVILFAEGEGEIVSFFMDRRSGGGSDFLSSFIYMDFEHCVWNHDRPASYDPDRGHVVREPWDVFVFEGRAHVLVVRHDYELLAMEVFRVDADRLVSVSQFGFSCLGCDR
jgi:hypothetical protein